MLQSITRLLYGIMSFPGDRNRDGFREYFKLNKSLLQIAGILPVERRGAFANSLVTFLMIVCNGFLSFPPIYAVIFNWQSLNGEERTEIFSTSVVLFVVLPKIVMLIVNRKRLETIIDKCERLWNSVETEEDRETVEPYALQGRHITFGFFLVVGGAYLSFLATPVIKLVYEKIANSTIPRERKVPFPMGFVPKDDTNYWILYAVQLPLGVATCVQIVGTDTLLAVMLMHACGHMRLVQSWLCEVGKRKANAVRGDIVPGRLNDHETRLRCVKCIAHHQRILSFAEDLESFFNPLILLQTALSVAIICFDGYNLLLGSVEQLKYVFHVPAGFLQLLMYCWPPDSLIAESFAVADAAYSAPWYEFSPGLRGTMRILMMRAQKPVTVTAAKFTVMSLEAYASMVSSAFTCFTVLKTTM